MADDELRALERDARASGAGDAVLRWAAALDRVGRPLDAVDALCLGRAHAGVRAALAARADLPRAPRGGTERFRVTLAGSDTPRLVHAGPLGLVLGSKARTSILDPDTAEVRHALPGAAWHGVAGDVVLTIRGKRPVIDARDLWTGEALWDAPLEGRTTSASLDAGWLVLSESDGLIGWRLADPRRPPELAWRADLEDTTDHVVAGDRLLVDQAGGTALLLLDAATGATLRELRRAGSYLAWAGAGHGVALHWDPAPPAGAPGADGDDGEWLLSAVASRDGADLWARVQSRAAVQPTRGAVVVSRPFEGHELVERLEPATGARRPPPAAVVTGATHLDREGVREPHDVDEVVPVHGADLLVGHGRGEVHCWPHDAGEVAWRWTRRPSRHVKPGDVRAAPGRVYVLAAGRVLVCLE